MSTTTAKLANFKLRLLLFFNSCWIGAAGGMAAWHAWTEHQAGPLAPAWRELAGAALKVKFFQLPTMSGTPWAREAFDHLASLRSWLETQPDATQAFLLPNLKTYLTWAPLVGALATGCAVAVLVNYLTKKAELAKEAS